MMSIVALPRVLYDIAERGRELLVQTAAAMLVAAVVIPVGRLQPLVRRHLRRTGRPIRTRVFTALTAGALAFWGLSLLGGGALVLAGTFVRPTKRTLGLTLPAIGTVVASNATRGPCSFRALPS